MSALIEAYDTTANRVMPAMTLPDKEVKNAVLKLMEGMLYTVITVKRDGAVSAQYVLNRKKNKWRKAI